MKKPKISIIVPVYNTEKYLSKCINSIISQSFSDFELLLIDDGSNDKSGKICDFFSIKDERIKVLHQKNGGVSKARNNGLKMANGKWLMFVDSDDTLIENALEKINKEMANHPASFYNFQYIRRYNDNKQEISNFVFEHNANSALYFIKQMLLHNASTGCWCNLYKSDIAKKIKFDEKICVGEDTHYVINYLINTSGPIHISQDVIYIYNDNPCSVMHNYDILVKGLECANDAIGTLLKYNNILNVCRNEYHAYVVFNLTFTLWNYHKLPSRSNQELLIKYGNTSYEYNDCWVNKYIQLLSYNRVLGNIYLLLFFIKVDLKKVFNKFD